MNLLSIVCGWLLVPVLSIVVWEDFKYRAVSWWLFLLLAAMAFFVEYQWFSFIDVSMNAGFVIIQLVILTIYFSIKEKKKVNLMTRYLGLGDILFWIILCLLFSPVNFTLFFMASMVLVMIVVGVWKIAKLKPVMTTVPLAGIQAAVLLAVLLIHLLSNNISFRDDRWIEAILLG
jgi:hypothetical protein